MRIPFICRSACAILASAAMLASGVAQERPSFDGKMLTMTVGFEAGNRVDLYGRILGRTLTRHLPGQPSVVVMNRPGAGGVIALNEWNVKAEPNGLFVTAGGQTQLDQDALIRTQARYKPEKFRYFGGLVAPSQGLFIRKDALPRLTDKSATPVAMGIVGSTLRTGYYQVLWGVAFLGWNVNWVRGYPSTTAARLALERGEVDMSAFGSGTDIDLLLATNKFVVATQSGAIINDTMTSRPVFGSAPVISDLVRGKIKDPVAQKAFEYSEKVIQVGMWAALPPGTSDRVLATYVDAFEATINDPQFKDDWAKIDPDSPVAHRAELEQLVNELGKVPADALDFIQAELKRQGVESGSR
jgi:hypothetical protein